MICIRTRRLIRVAALVALMATRSSFGFASTPTPEPATTQCDPSVADSCPVDHHCLCCCGTWVCMPPYLPCCALPCAAPTTPTPTPTCPPPPPVQCLPDYDHVCQIINDCTTCQCVLRATPTPTAPECDQNCNGHCGSFSCGPGACVAIDSGCACAPPECPTLTFTPMPPTATSTPTPTPTTTPPTSTCIGDCSGDGTVDIGDLILGVTILLGNAPLDACPSLDCCHVFACIPDVTCLIVAVNNALYGCEVTLPTPTPTPQCSNVPCEGSCVVFPPCTPSPDSSCPNSVQLGMCALNPLNGCQCEPVQPVTPTPTPPPVLYHGHICCECPGAACVNFAWVEVEPMCSADNCVTFIDAECEAPCHGGPQSSPAVCVSLTPCTTDADCDDGNGCTADNCTIDGCTHQCVCD